MIVDLDKDSRKKLVYGNVYDKYNTWNPAARILMQRYIETVKSFVGLICVRKIHEVGCGEGRLGTIFSRLGYEVQGTDLSPEVVSIARREAGIANLNMEFRVADIYGLREKNDSADLILCCEVLEHLTKPDRALKVLVRLASPYLIAGVPREPVWRILNFLRGKYWRHFGNTPGHVQHWSSEAFAELLGRNFDIIAVANPLPWTVILCRRKNGT